MNTVNYTGMRLSALYKINDDWNLLIQQNYQNMNADGYFQVVPEWLGAERDHRLRAELR